MPRSTKPQLRDWVREEGTGATAGQVVGVWVADVVVAAAVVMAVVKGEVEADAGVVADEV